MPTTETTPAETTTSRRVGMAVRMLAPAVPLAIALIHGAMVGPAPGTAPQGGPPIAAMAKKPTRSPLPPKLPPTPLSRTDCKADVPCPLLEKGHPVNWWFVFKLNAGVFPGCDNANTCAFGGSPQAGPKYPVGQRFVYASSEQATLADGGKECLGTSTGDPVGATFDEVYNNGSFFYLVWNDQFYDIDPTSVLGCSKGQCGAPWGHSKGMLAWNAKGEGFVMQVSTPEWPGGGSTASKRKIGNTLGCLSADDDVKVSQHFFALRLTKSDLLTVIQGLADASVATDPADLRVAKLGGPDDVVTLAKTLGAHSKQKVLRPGTPAALSSGVMFIAKPSLLPVPPWQMVSSVLGGVNLRVATWWTSPAIDSTAGGKAPGCWDASLKTVPGAVEIATSGSWKDQEFQLHGGPGVDSNHAKVGVSTSGSKHFVIFGDENQQGTLAAKTTPKPQGCDSSQNGRGGMFFAMENAELAKSVSALLAGESDPVP